MIQFLENLVLMNDKMVAYLSTLLTYRLSDGAIRQNPSQIYRRKAAVCIGAFARDIPREQYYRVMLIPRLTAREQRQASITGTYRMRVS